MQKENIRKPEWLRIRLPKREKYGRVKSILSKRGLHTVCQEAQCPNLCECWERGTATFMILGSICTRGCAFCAVKRGQPEQRPSKNEAALVAEAAVEMGLRYVVITSVTRDDLPDGGAGLFAETTRMLTINDPELVVETLIPDFKGDPLRSVLSAQPGVLAHNIEVVERLTPLMRHPRFSYKRSLSVLAAARNIAPWILTKSSLLLGLGESDKEIIATMKHLREEGVSILVLGQYLRPQKNNTEVVDYITPQKFDELASIATEMGFRAVAAAPLARTSYRASETYNEAKKVPSKLKTSDIIK